MCGFTASFGIQIRNTGYDHTEGSYQIDSAVREVTACTETTRRHVRKKSCPGESNSWLRTEAYTDNDNALYQNQYAL